MTICSSQVCGRGCAAPNWILISCRQLVAGLGPQAVLLYSVTLQTLRNQPRGHSTQSRHPMQENSKSQAAPGQTAEDAPVQLISDEEAVEFTRVACTIANQS